MSEAIYQNILSLTLINRKTELEYQRMRDKQLSYFSTSIIVFSILASWSVMVFQYFFYDLNHEIILFKLNVIMTTISSIIYVFILVIGIKTNNIKIIRYINYFIFYFQIFVIIAFRYAIFRVVSVTPLLLFLQYLIETIVRLIWVVGFIHSFIESVLLNLSSLATVWLIIVLLIPEKFYESEISNTINYTLVIIAVIAISYVLERQQKLAFYYRLHADSKVKRLTNSFENLKSGFVSLKNGRISFINKHSKDILSNRKFQDKTESRRKSNAINSFTEVNQPLIFENDKGHHETIITIKDHSNFASFNTPLYNLITLLNYDSLDGGSTKNIMSKFQMELSLLSPVNMTSNYSTVFNLLTTHISQLPQIENFTYIGEISFSHDGQDYHYEVNCRLNNLDQNEETELLFNDITRTKIKEKENQEYKYKSLYFSKVIHEFKNPLICISELVSQTQDIISVCNTTNNNCMNKNVKNLSSKLEEINSMANFLQILIKDFTHLTESQFQKIKDYQKNETDIKSLVDFCGRIGNTLIKKYNKNEDIEFRFNKDNKVPNMILTDEWKLKQIIINLISNSIKFTLKGFVSLDITLEKLNVGPLSIENTNYKEQREFTPTHHIKFLVKDTGVGMNQELVKNISKPFKKGSNIYNKKYINEFGSGLGLSIVHEMASILGSGLECETKLGEGTSFWFYIPIQIPETKEITNELISNLEPNSCVEYDITDQNKLDCDLPNDQSNSVISLKSFTTKILKDLYFQKPPGIYSDYNAQCYSDDMIDSIIVNSQRNYNKSLSSEKDKVRESSSSIFKKRKLSKKSTINTQFKELFKLNYNSPLTKNQVNFRNTNKKPSVNVNSVNGSNINAVFNMCNFYFYNEPVKKNIDKTDIDIEILSNFINIIVCDDESLIRQSTIRTLKNVSKFLNLNVNIIETIDGVETVSLVYKFINIGKKISLIFSDENMTCMNGTKSWEIIKEILTRKKAEDIPFYLLTACEGNMMDNNSNLIGNSPITKVFEKPLEKNFALEVLKKFKFE